MDKRKTIAIALVLVFAGIIAYFFISSETASTEVPSYVGGEMREIYNWAKTPEGATLLEQMPCYCGCKEAGHLHSRHCFWRDDGTFDKHGITCSVCLDIAKRTKRMHEEGKTICEIRNTIDEFYATSKELGTDTPMPEGCGSASGENKVQSSGPQVMYLPEAYSFYGKPNVDFIDVREIESIKSTGGKIIKGAEHIPLSELADKMEQINCDHVNIFVCEGTFGGGECTASPAAARIVMKSKNCKAENMRYLEEGHGAWEAAGYPVEDIEK